MEIRRKTGNTKPNQSRRFSDGQKVASSRNTSSGTEKRRFSGSRVKTGNAAVSGQQSRSAVPYPAEHTGGAERTAKRTGTDPAARRRRVSDTGKRTASAGKRVSTSEKRLRSANGAKAGSASSARKQTAAGRRIIPLRSLKRGPAGRTGKTLPLKQKLLIAGGVLVALILCYCLIANGYRKKFLPHTFINSFDVGSLSVAEAENILKKSVETYSLELGFRGGSIRTMTGEDVNLTYVSSNEVEKILSGQNRAGWIRNFFGKHTSYSVSTSFKFDSDKLRSYLESLPEFQEANITKPVDAHIVKKVNNTFKVASEVNGNEPSEDVIFEAVDHAINHSEVRLNLDTVEGAYVSPGVRFDDEDLNYTVERFNSFVNTNISIKTKDGSVQKYGRDQLIDWFTQDESTGVWSLSKENVYKRCYAIMQAIADRDDDAKSTVRYESTYNGTVVLPCARYGYLVDVEKETDKMNDALLAREDRDIEIENSASLSIDPKNGGTYVEVDVTNQVVTYYKNGEIYVQTECVTGKENDPERRTPSGVYSVLNKLENQTLGSLTALDPGQRYESHVDYWMPFFESYGMHDATWRENFGGSMYWEYGSHGCVNLPPEAAEKIYKDIDYYTPVIVVRAGDNAPDGTRRGNTTWNPPDGGLHYSESDDD